MFVQTNQPTKKNREQKTRNMMLAVCDLFFSRLFFDLSTRSHVVLSPVFQNSSFVCSFHVLNEYYWMHATCFTQILIEYKPHLYPTILDTIGVDILNYTNFRLKNTKTISIIRAITKSVYTAKFQNGNPLSTTANKYDRENTQILNEDTTTTWEYKRKNKR